MTSISRIWSMPRSSNEDAEAPGDYGCFGREDLDVARWLRPGRGSRTCASGPTIPEALPKERYFICNWLFIAVKGVRFILETAQACRQEHRRGYGAVDLAVLRR